MEVQWTCPSLCFGSVRERQNASMKIKEGVEDENQKNKKNTILSTISIIICDLQYAVISARGHL